MACAETGKEEMFLVLLSEGGWSSPVDIGTIAEWIEHSYYSGDNSAVKVWHLPDASSVGEDVEPVPVTFAHQTTSRQHDERDGAPVWEHRFVSALVDGEAVASASFSINLDA